MNQQPIYVDLREFLHRRFFEIVNPSAEDRHELAVQRVPFFTSHVDSSILASSAHRYPLCQPLRDCLLRSAAPQPLFHITSLWLPVIWTLPLRERRKRYNLKCHTLHFLQQIDFCFCAKNILRSRTWRAFFRFAPSVFMFCNQSLLRLGVIAHPFLQCISTGFFPYENTPYLKTLESSIAIRWNRQLLVL